MAQAQNYRPSQDVYVAYQQETTVGTAPDNAGLKTLQTTGFSIPEASVPVEYSGLRSGIFPKSERVWNLCKAVIIWYLLNTL